MPKENTHLYFAKRLLDNPMEKEIMEPVKNSKRAFFLGCIFPDSFYYHRQKDVEALSDRLHGRGENAGQTIIGFLKKAKMNLSIPDYAFTMGYISHWSLDKIFHPVIGQLCEDYPDSHSEKKLTTVYQHRLLETDLDRRINNGCYVHEMIDLNSLSALDVMQLLAEHTGINETEFQAAFERQKRINRMMTKKWAYIWVRLLKLIGKKGMNEILPLFYAHLKIHREPFPDAVYDESSENNDQKYRSVEDLFQQAEAFARSVFAPVDGFFNDTGESEESFLSEIRRLLAGSV
jgi:hypothetical protein